MPRRWNSKVYDGSKHEIAKGYWLCKAVAADTEHKKLIPLYLEAYSQKAHDFKSENYQLFKAINAVSSHIGNKGIYAIDRGGDMRVTLRLSFLRKERRNDLSFAS